MRFRWDGRLSDTFTVSNGVRQGGILSPYLFNVYMHGLSDLLNDVRTGCISGGIVVNHLMYADDLVLMSPSATGLQNYWTVANCTVMSMLLSTILREVLY